MNAPMQAPLLPAPAPDGSAPPAASMSNAEQQQATEETSSNFVEERQDASSKAQISEEESLQAETPAIRWTFTLLWAGAILVWYTLVQCILLPWAMKPDPAAREMMLSQVPIRIYQYSEAAFFTAAVLNLISFVFEETQEKRQLALLSALIKGLSWHCDYLIVTGQAVVTFDAYHALLLPSRYVQWSCTTPTMLFCLSKISDFTPQQTAIIMFADWVMILTGYIAAVFPPGFVSYSALFISFVTMFIVLYGLYLIIRSAVTETSSPHAKKSLEFTLWSSVVIWNLFPLAWLAARMGPRWAPLGEPLLLFSNFAAKVVFSSCILYNNYVTLQQRRLAAQLVLEQEERIKMVAELKASLRHKDEFISVVGHELRTPLNAIIQLSTAMSPNLGTPSMAQSHKVWMETITRSARHLMGIINDIITIRAARSGINLKQELVHVKGLVDHVMHALHPTMKRGVTMERLIADKLPPIVADERRIFQVLSNLLGNALKFTEKGKVSVSVRADKGARNVVIKVQDTGCGIPKSELKNLLVPFKQVDMSAGRKYGGTGLGLSIANQLVQVHSGKLEVYSQEGVGTTVAVTLPVLQPETQKSLEIQFRKGYAAAGYDPDDLLNPLRAKAEGRLSTIFCEATEGGLMRTWPGDKTDQIDRMQWEADMADVGASAAGSGESGPPPMAVALFSQLYASTSPDKAIAATSAPPDHLKGFAPAPRPRRNSQASRLSQTSLHNAVERLDVHLEPASVEGLDQQLRQAQQAVALAVEAERAVNKDQKRASLSGVASKGLDELEAQLLRAQEAIAGAVREDQAAHAQALAEERESHQQRAIEALEKRLMQAQQALTLAMEAERTVNNEQRQQALAQGSAESDHLENLELQLLQAQHALAVALEATAATGNDTHIHGAGAGAGHPARSRHSRERASVEMSEQSLAVMAEFPGGVGSKKPSGEKVESEQEETHDEEEDDEFDPYPGAWHRAPRFGDEHDGNKEYYGYDSRLSYDYRPSLDMPGPAFAAAFRSVPGKTSPLANTAANPLPLGLNKTNSVRSEKEGFKTVVKSAIRRSIDAVRLRALTGSFSTSKLQMAGRSTISLSVANASESASVHGGSTVGRTPNSMTAIDDHMGSNYHKDL